MELRQLRYFVTTADTLSFSEAARKLFISQSTLSQQIRQLEDELGTELLARNSHKVALTEAGDRLLPLARKTIEDADTCRTQLIDLKENVSGDLNIGVTNSFSSVMEDALKQFLTQYQGVTINIYYANTTVLVDLLRQRKIDLALAFKPQQARPDIEAHELFRDELCAVVRKDHELAQRSKVTLNQLEKYSVAMPSKEMQVRGMLNRYIENTQPKFKIRIQLNDAHFLLELIEGSSLLVGILSRNHTQSP